MGTIWQISVFFCRTERFLGQKLVIFGCFALCFKQQTGALSQRSPNFSFLGSTRKQQPGPQTCSKWLQPHLPFKSFLANVSMRALLLGASCAGGAKRFTRCRRALRGNPKYHPFWGSSLFYKAPQDNFGLQNVNWHPPKFKLTPCKKGLATSNLQFLYRNTQKSPLDNLYFGGRHFAFWRLKLSWGGFIEKGWSPKRVVF